MHSRPSANHVLAAVLGAFCCSAPSAQIPFRSPASPLTIELPPGAAGSLARGPALAARILRAADGSNAARFLIGLHTPGCEHKVVPIPGGHRWQFRCGLQHPGLGTFRLDAELDVTGPAADGSWDLRARITSMPAGLAVSSLGIDFEMLDGAGTETLMIPAFSGAEFVEPATTIPLTSPIDTSVAHSLQASAYYGDDGTGVLVLARDPTAMKPKHFLAASGKNQAGQRTVSFAFEYYMPNPHVGGRPAATPVATAVVPYSYDPTLSPGWYEAAKIYRSWLEANARGKGEILERGRLESRKDVPRWIKEVDLFNAERYGWFPHKATVKNPLFALRRYKTELGARQVFVGLWFWNDVCSPLGRQCSYLPLPATKNQVQAMLADDIRFAGYTFPWIDVANPLFRALHFDRHAVEDRSGNPKTTDLFFKGKKQLHWILDVASPLVADWWEILAGFHASWSGLSGFYFDFPATVESADFRRPSGDLGITESAYRGFKEMMRRAQEGAASVGREFASYHEAAYEWLIPVTPTGEGATGVIGRAYPGETRTRGIPFFQTVYSGYTMFWPADELLGTAHMLLVGDAYGDPRRSNISRLLAEGFTWGHILNSSDFALADGKLFWEVAVAEPLKSFFQHHKKTLRNLIALRHLARRWIVYGEMLNSPVAGGDETDVTIKIPFRGQLSQETFRKLAVPATAWRAQDGSIRIVAANGGRATAAVSLNLRRIGLPASWKLVDVRTNETFGPDRRGHIRLTVAGGTGRLLAPAR